MTQLPLPDAIDRFKENEERIDTFVNGDENASYEPIGGGDDVPSVQKFLADKDAEINVAAEGILEQTSEQRALAQAWAESATAPDIGDPTSKSAKTWAGESAAYAQTPEDTEVPGGSGYSALHYAAKAGADAAVLASMAVNEANTFVVETAGVTFPLAFDPGDHKLLLTVNGVAQTYGVHYTVAGDDVTFSEALRVGDRVSYLMPRPIPFDPNLNRLITMPSRVALVSHVATYGVLNGETYLDGEAFYLGEDGADGIEDLPGLVLLFDVQAATTEIDAAIIAATAAAIAAQESAAAAELAVTNAQAAALTVATWTALSALTSSVAGTGAEVLDSDTGTHTDPVVGGTVNNAGRYSWSASPAGWRRIGDTGVSAVAPIAQRAGDLATDNRVQMGGGVDLPGVAIGPREMRPSDVTFDLRPVAGIMADTGLPWRPDRAFDDLAPGLPTEMQIGTRTLRVDDWSHDLRPASGVWADTGKAWTADGVHDSLLPVTEVEIAGQIIAVTEWSYDLRPLRGYVAATGAAWPLVSGVAVLEPDQEVIVGAGTISIYLRQYAGVYVEWVYALWDNAATNAHVWRTSGKWHVIRDGSGAYTRVQNIGFDGEYELAVLLVGIADSIGGRLHGNEEHPKIGDAFDPAAFRVHVDGVQIDHTVAARYVCTRLDIYQHSIGYLPGATEATTWSPKGPAMLDIYKRARFERGEWTLTLRIESLAPGPDIERAAVAMDCIPWGSNWPVAGEGAVHTAAREPYWAVEDVSPAGFAEILTDAGHLTAWGDLYSYEVRVNTGWTDDSAIKVDSRPDRRKIYPYIVYDAPGSLVLPYTVSITHITTIKEPL